MAVVTARVLRVKLGQLKDRDIFQRGMLRLGALGSLRRQRGCAWRIASFLSVS
jgi:hypothetical protein